MSNDMIGRKLGQYELRERLGRGGMAEVYKAYQPGMDRFVAVKLMLGHLSTDEHFVARFRREAQAVGKLRHPHIVNVFDFGIETDVYYMVMEYITGGTLKEAITTAQHLAVKDALRITRQIADALDYAHNAGMIHRDLKPANIMFTDAALQNAILTDFGIARILTESGLTASGMMVGTPAYMSPEAGHGLPADERADIYALGIILYEMLTGEVPYSADTPMAVVMKHIMAPIPPLHHLRLPEPAEMIIVRSLAKQPDERYQTAADMRDALDEAILEVRNTPTPPPMPIQRGETVIALATPLPQPTAADALDATNVVAKAGLKAATRENQPTDVIAPANEAPPSTQQSWVVLALGALALLAILAVVIGVATGTFDIDGGTREDEDDTIPISVLGGPQRAEDTPVPVAPSATIDPILLRSMTETAMAVNAVTGPLNTPSTVVAGSDPTEAPTEAPTDVPTPAATAIPTEIPTEAPPTAVAEAVFEPTRPLELSNVAGIEMLSNISPTMDDIDTRLLNGQFEPDVAVLLAEALAEDPNNVETLAALSTVHFMRGEADSAQQYAQQAYQQDAENVLALLAMSDAAWINDDFATALTYANTASTIAPENPEVWWRVSRGLYGTGDIPAAQVALGASFENGARGYRFAHFAGTVFLEVENDPETAIAFWYAVAASPMRSVEASYSLLTALVYTGRYFDSYEAARDFADDGFGPAALANYAFVAFINNDSTLAEEWLAEAESLDANAPTLRYMQALLAANAGDYESAEVLLAALRAEGVTELAPFFTLSFEHHVVWDLAGVQNASGDYEAAIASYTALIETLGDATPPQLLMDRGDAYMALDDNDNAVTDYQLALDQALLQDADPDTRNAARQRAVDAYFPDFSAYVGLYPPDAPFFAFEDSSINYLSGLSDVQNEYDRRLFGQRDPAAARAYLDAQLAETPDDPAVQYAHFNDRLLFGDDTSEAVAVLDDMVGGNPESLFTHLAWIDLALVTNEALEDALLVANTGLELFPNNPHLLWRRAAVQFRLIPDDPSLAETDFINARNNGASGVAYAGFAAYFAPAIGDPAHGVDAAITAFVAYEDLNFVSLIIGNLIQAGRTDEAFAFAESAAYLGDYYPAIFNHLAYAAYRAGAYDVMRSWTWIAFALSEETHPTSSYLFALWAWYANGDAETAIATLNELAWEDNSARLLNIDYGHVKSYDLAKILYQDGDYAQALSTVNQTIADYEWWWEGYFLRGQIYTAVGETANARTDLQAALDRATITSPDRVPDIEAALSTLDNEGVIIDPSAVAAVEGIAMLSGISPTMDEIDTRLISGMDDLDPIEILDARLMSDPNNAEVLAAQSTLYQMRYDTQNTLRTAQAAYEADPTSIPALIAYCQANLSQDSVLALDIALQAHTLAPDDPNVLWTLSAAYLQNGNALYALVYLDNAIAAGAGGYRFASYAGDVLLDEGDDPDRALPYLIAVEASPLSDVGRYYMLANAYLQMGDEASAYELTQKWVNIVSDPFALANFAYVAYRVGEFDQATTWLDTANRQQDGLDNERYTRALVAFEQGDFDTADLLFTSLRMQGYIETWPFLTGDNGHNLLLDHALVQTASGDTAAAIESYTTFLDSYSWVPGVFVARGDLYRQTDQTDLALNDFGSAMFYASQNATDENQAIGNAARRQALDLAFGDGAAQNTDWPQDEPFYSQDDTTINVLSGISDIADDFETRLIVEGDQGSALVYLDEILRENPTDTEASFVRFEYLLYYEGNIEGAQAVLDVMIENDYDNVQTFAARIDFALFWSQDDPASALDIANEGLAMHPDNPHLLWRRALVHDSLGQSFQGETDYLAAREAGANGSGYAFVAAHFASNMGDLAYAREAAITLWLANPYDTENLSRLLTILVRLGRADEAVNFARSVQTRIGDSPYLFNELAYAAFVANAYEDMRVWLQTAAVMSPDSRNLTDYLLGLLAWYGDGDAETAIRLLTDTTYPDNNSRFINVDFGHVRLYDIAKIQAASGDTEAALDSVSEAILYFDWWWELYYFRANLYLEQGDSEAARADLNAALGRTSDLDQLNLIQDLQESLPPAPETTE